MLTLPRPHRAANRIITVVCILLLIGGLYMLYVIFSPTIELAITDPSNNKTTEALKNSTTKPKDAWLYIPKINLSVPYGKDEDALKTGAWWRKPENGNPVDGGNFVLAGHRFVMNFIPGGTNKQSPFYNIGRLEVGDKIYIDYKNQRYIYAITKKYSVKPTAVEIENRTDKPQLTLYSCTFEGQADGRDVIIATPSF